MITCCTLWQVVPSVSVLGSWDEQWLHQAISSSQVACCHVMLALQRGTRLASHMRARQHVADVHALPGAAIQNRVSILLLCQA